MYRNTTSYLILFLLLSFNSCVISAGHGSLTSYNFETSKAKLETAVMKVIAEDKNIYREPKPNQEVKDIYKKIAKERNNENKDFNADLSAYSYYNDGKNYLTITIKNKNYKFIFRYYGGEEEWKTSPTSSFFVVYAYNQFGHGGGYNNNLDAKLVKELTTAFESEFVDKVQKELGIKYKVEE